jgi:hypothetical protein
MVIVDQIYGTPFDGKLFIVQLVVEHTGADVASVSLPQVSGALDCHLSSSRLAIPAFQQVSTFVTRLVIISNISLLSGPKSPDGAHIYVWYRLARFFRKHSVEFLYYILACNMDDALRLV